MSDLASSNREIASRILWIQVLSGPVLWSAHFLISYLLLEIFCNVEGLGFYLLGVNGISFILVVLTILAVIGVVLAGVWSYRDWKARQDEDLFPGRFNTTARWVEDPVDFMQFSAVLLSVLFAATIVLVAVPVFILQPCNRL